MALLTPTDITLAGTADTTTTPTASTGDTFKNTEREYVEIHNGSGSGITVTIDAFPSGGQGAPASLTVTDPTISIANGATKRIGPFARSVFNNDQQLVKVTCSAVSSVTIGVYRLPAAAK